MHELNLSEIDQVAGGNSVPRGWNDLATGTITGTTECAAYIVVDGLGGGTWPIGSALEVRTGGGLIYVRN